MPKIIENLREKLISETKLQLQEYGYAALNIRSIAKSCGVGVGTVYNYFPSKDAMIAGFLLEDWMECISRIRCISENQSSDLPLQDRQNALLKEIYQELSAFHKRYQDLFQAASQSVAAPPKRYHVILREQLAQLIRPLCQEDFTAEFAAEALLTWTVEGIPFEKIGELILKTIS